MRREYKPEEKAEIKRAIIDLLPKKGYHIGKVCKQVGIARNTFYRWQKEDEDFMDQTEEQFEYDVDDSEEKLRLLRQGLPRFDEDGKFIGWKEKPHFGALIKHLEAKGKSRGYGQQLEINDKRTEELEKMTDAELFAKINRMNGIVQPGEED